MFTIVNKSIHCFAATNSQQPHNFNIFRLQQFSSSKCVTPHSFPVSYLMNEFGFSLEKAVVASKKLKFENGDKPDAVVSFLKNEGFTQTQIRKVISADSRILSYKPESILLPKLQFFRSKGVSSTDLAKMVGNNVDLLRRSLNDYIVPNFNSFIDLFGSDEGVILVLKGDSMLFNYTHNHVKSNIKILRAAGVPYSMVASFLKYKTRLFRYGPDKLKESVEQVQKMGMDPQRYSYGAALALLMVIPRSKLNEKIEAYRRWGCSEDLVLTSFKIQPMVLSSSVEKINSLMRFCVNEMGWEPSEVVRRYYFLTLSLNKRIMPRWSVYQELVSKRLIKDKGKMTSMFRLSDNLFLNKYVHCYKNEAPLLLKLYSEKLEASK